ncbi:hypothetical protein EDD63_1355 [Breznakia blatticola]|uniref:Bacteriocin-associated integral membrane protein n=1 Tax=Breznakia blatticola TaxID=1754012 RepID=A0A4R7ZHZ9_9FIRM|nr:hypothetical protein EDD63_1355 [Breznakia blatticola]
MKKILLMLSGIFMIFCFLYIHIDAREKFIHEESVNTRLGSSLEFMVYEYEEQTYTNQDADFIVKLAEKYNVSVVTNNGSTENKVNQFVALNNKELLERYNIDSNFNFDKYAVLSSNEQIATVGQINTFDNTIELTKRSFYNELNTRLDGWYFVFGENREQFYHEFQKHFPNQIEIIETYDEDLNHEVTMERNPNYMKMIKFGLIFSCSAIVILLLVFSTESKDVSIKKMNGYSNFRIVKDSLLVTSILMVIIDVVIVAVMTVLNIPKLSDVHIPMFQNIIIAVACKYIVIAVVYCIVLLYIKSIGISILLKKKGISKFILNVNTIMRVVFVFLLTISLFDSLPGFINTIKVAAQFNGFIEECSDYTHSTEIQGFLNQEGNERIYKFAKDVQKNEQYVGIYLGNYDNNLNLSYAWVDVNYNYLKKYEIYDKYNKQVIDLDESKQYLLVPEEYVNDPMLYKKRVERLKDFLEFEEIIIKDNQRIFTFNLNYDEGKLGYIQQSPILVSDDFTWGDLYFKKSSDPNYENAQNMLHEYGIENEFVYSLAKEEGSFILDLQLSTLIYEATMILLYISLLVLLIVQYLFLMFEVNRKEYIVKKMHGYSFISRYVDLILLLICSYVVNFILLITLNYEINSFVILLIILLIDILFTSMVVYRLENKSIAIVLKGD